MSVDISGSLLLSAIVSQLIACRDDLQMLIACHVSVVCVKFQVSLPNYTPGKLFSDRHCYRGSDKSLARPD